MKSDRISVRRLEVLKTKNIEGPKSGSVVAAAAPTNYETTGRDGKPSSHKTNCTTTSIYHRGSAVQP